MYRRFLNNRDYLGIITEQALNQLVRGENIRFEQAEQAAEASIRDYLSEHYEIDHELNKGKFICPYDKKITYPVGCFFYLDGKICETIKAISGYKAPASQEYWKEVTGYVNDTGNVCRYSQMENYSPGDIVEHQGNYYQCVSENGYDFNEIRIPGLYTWARMETYQWDSIPYKLWDVVRFQGHFYALISLKDFDQMVNPMESDNWGLIGDYDPDHQGYELSEHEYVVYQDEIYYPTIDPNFDTPQIGVNIREDDPRNYNLKKHMVQLALYELHKLISPVNISSVRVDDYEHSIQWLRDASKLKLNPQIPRKVGDRDYKPITDWQMATFQANYDPDQNIWLI